MAYASDTEVPVEKSRAEIEKHLQRAGASRFAYMTEEDSAMIGFVLNKLTIRFVLPLPARSDERFWKTPGGKRQRTQEEAYKFWEQACRSRWRALMLCIRAKLEAVECGITTFEEEFLAHIVVAGGRTIGELAIPQLERALEAGTLPTLALEFGGK